MDVRISRRTEGGGVREWREGRRERKRGKEKEKEREGGVSGGVSSFTGVWQTMS